VVPGRRIIGTYGGLEGLYLVIYFTGAVRNENTNYKGFGSFRESVNFSVLTDKILDRDLLRLVIAYLSRVLPSHAASRSSNSSI
jgi:hypothetical protein